MSKNPEWLQREKTNPWKIFKIFKFIIYSDALQHSQTKQLPNELLVQPLLAGAYFGFLNQKLI